MELDTLIFIFDTFYKRTYIPISIVDCDGKLRFPQYSPIYLKLSEYPYLTTFDAHPIHIINTYQVLLASFQYQDYTILLGPCFLLGAKQNKTDFFSQFKTYTSTESLQKFSKTLNMLYTLLTHQTVDIDAIPIQYITTNHKALHTKTSFEENVYHRRSEDSTKDSYQIELRFIDYIKRGRRDKVEWMFSQFGKTYAVDLAQHSLDSMKIKFISMVTLVTRIAIDAGVSLENAFSLSDALIQNLSTITSMDECLRYIKYGIYEFMNLITPAARKCSIAINQCLSYIDTHIYDKITLQDLESVTSHSMVYLSTRFKKELGITFSKYVLEKKIEEAKHLLLFTDQSFQQIAALLNFASQSHFTQRFKQVTKLTPKEFRNKNFQYM